MIYLNMPTSRPAHLGPQNQNLILNPKLIENYEKCIFWQILQVFNVKMIIFGQNSGFLIFEVIGRQKKRY